PVALSRRVVRDGDGRRQGRAAEDIALDTGRRRRRARRSRRRPPDRRLRRRRGAPDGIAAGRGQTGNGGGTPPRLEDRKRNETLMSMMSSRTATAKDRQAIRLVEEHAFGQKMEAGLVDALVASGDTVLELVAEEEGQVVGHILFSRLYVEHGGKRFPAVA